LICFWIKIFCTIHAFLPIKSTTDINSLCFQLNKRLFFFYPKTSYLEEPLLMHLQIFNYDIQWQLKTTNLIVVHALPELEAIDSYSVNIFLLYFVLNVHRILPKTLLFSSRKTRFEKLPSHKSIHQVSQH
jgi:hypothetical protein